MHSVGWHCPPGKSTPDRCWQNAHGGVGCADGATARLVYLAVGRPIPVARQIPDLALNHRLARGITPGDKTTPTGWLLLGAPLAPPGRSTGHRRPVTTAGSCPAFGPWGLLSALANPDPAVICGKASNDCWIGCQDRRKLGQSIVTSWHCCHWANSCCCRSSGSIAAAAERPRHPAAAIGCAIGRARSAHKRWRVIDASPDAQRQSSPQLAINTGSGGFPP